MSTYEDLHFIAGPGISGRAPSTASYELKLPASAKAESARLAGLFGVSGAPAEHGGGNWTVTSTSGAVLNYDSVGVPQWYYSSTTPKVAPAEESGSVSVAMPSHAIVEADVQRYVSELGYHYSLSLAELLDRNDVDDDARRRATDGLQRDRVILGGRPRHDDGPVAQLHVRSHQHAALRRGTRLPRRRRRELPAQSPRAGVTALGTAEKRPFAAVAKPPDREGDITSDRCRLAPYRLKNGTCGCCRSTHTRARSPGRRAPPRRERGVELAVEPTYVAGSSATSEGVSH